MLPLLTGSAWTAVTASAVVVALAPSTAPSGSTVAEPAASPSLASHTWHLGPGDSWAGAIRRASAGDVIELASGRYPTQSLAGISGKHVVIHGASRSGTVVQGIYLNDSNGITFSNFTATSPATGSASALRVTNDSHDLTFDQLTVLPTNDPAGRSGFDVYSNSGSTLPPYRITLSNSLVDASASSGTASRGVRIWGGDFAESTWPHDITIHHDEIRGADGDIIQIGGARNVTVADNLLHDPHENSDHNDGIQSYGSRNLVITGNRIWAAGAQGGPDQGIIIGASAGATYLKVNQTKIENNLVVGWRGQGICIAGADYTLVRQNTVVDNGGSSLVISAAGSVHDTRLSVSNNILDRIERADTLQLAYEDYNLLTPLAGATGRGKHTVVADPRFAELTNYTLQPTSPAIGRGSASTGVRWDYAGTARATADIGARQHGTGSPAASTMAWGNTYGR